MELAVRGGPVGRQQGVEFANLVAHESLAQQQIHGGVAGEDQLGQHDDIGVRIGGLRGSLFDEPAVAAKIADDGV